MRPWTGGHQPTCTLAGLMSDPNRFDPGSVDMFRIVDRRFDPETRTAHLQYAFDDRFTFEETITFETPPAPGEKLDMAGLQRALLHLHIAAGTSYYKAAAPDDVHVEGSGLAPADAEFHRHLYDDGLREFAMSNALPVPRPVTI